MGHQDGTDYLVMEFLEGETLAARLVKGALPAEQVLRYGIEIADALDKAHRQGIAHRDLKPGNVMLTKSGVKLLDFGLAKFAVPASLTSGLSVLPTQAAENLTAEGTILGTFQYMAPEQLEGKEADARTDIFAFGAVLYEMATGQKAFSGKSQASLIGAILHTEPPPISTVQPMAPPALDRLVRTCLAKDPEERWQTAHDVMLQLKWIAEGGSQVGVPAPVAVRRKSRERLAWSVAAVLAALAIALVFAVAHYRITATGTRPVRALVLPPEKSAFKSVGVGGPVAVSPDGRRLAFVAATSDGKSLLYVRTLEALTAQALPGTEGASYPFWSPDSRFVGFFADAKLKKIEATAGPALALCDAQEARGGTWGEEGVILFAKRYSPIYRVSASGGVAVEVTKLDAARQEVTHRWPQFLPDGRHFLYLASPTGSENEKNAVFLASLDGTEKRLLLPVFSNVAYASGHLLFVREGTLMAQPFDVRRRRLSGDSFPVVEGIQYDPVFARAVFSVSNNGVLAYQGGTAQTRSRLVWCDRSGKPLDSIGEPDVHFRPRLSPDGRRIAVTIYETRSGNYDIWIYEAARGIKTRFTFDPARDLFPVWSPDGRSIVFASERKGPKLGFGSVGTGDLYQKNSDGTGSEELLLQSADDKSPTSFSPDGRFLAYHTGSRVGKTKSGVWILPLSGDRKPFPFLQTQFNDYGADFSPDGRWIAYASDESGRPEIYVTRFPGPAGKWQVSTNGGIDPRWRRDGKELFFVRPAPLQLMAAEVKTGSSFESGAPRALFPLRSFIGTLYDASGDGQRILVNMPTEEETSSPITLVLNWTADLKR